VTFAATGNRGAKIADGNPVLVSRYFYCLSTSRLGTYSLPCLGRFLVASAAMALSKATRMKIILTIDTIFFFLEIIVGM